MNESQVFEIETREDCVVITLLRKELNDEDECRTLRESIQEILEGDNVTAIVIDLNKVEYMNSVMLQNMLYWQRHAKRLGKPIAACQVRSDVYETFKITHVSKQFPNHGSVAKATESFS